MVVLGAGLAGTGVFTAGWSGTWLAGSVSPLSVCRVPPVIVADPVTPDAEALHVLAMLAAVSTSFCEVFTLLIVAVLVTVPPAGVPWVLTLICPEEKKVAGSMAALPVGAPAVTAVAEPPAGRVTDG